MHKKMVDDIVVVSTFQVVTIFLWKQGRKFNFENHAKEVSSIFSLDYVKNVLNLDLGKFDGIKLS